MGSEAIEGLCFLASCPLAGTGQREGGEKTQPFNHFPIPSRYTYCRLVKKRSTKVMCLHFCSWKLGKTWTSSVSDLILMYSTVDCTWGAWSAWETCSLTCGNGTQERNRTITQEALNGGTDCTGNETETQSCNTFGCPGKYQLSIDVISVLPDSHPPQSVSFTKLSLN